MMNEPRKPDFFSETVEKLTDLTYQNTEEDLRHEEYLCELQATIFDNSDASLDDDLGELPFDEEADRQRWDELEKDFDRVFDEAKGLNL